MTRETWMERTLADEIVNIDDEIAAWHDAPEPSRGQSFSALPTWLGMTEAEYGLFVAKRHALPAIVGRRAATERKAWARLVTAAVADMDSLHMVATDPTEESAADHGEKNAAYWAAVRALRDLGVDVDALLGDT